MGLQLYWQGFAWKYWKGLGNRCSIQLSYGSRQQDSGWDRSDIGFIPVKTITAERST